jgi:capsular polysaccharide biosynthesis protein
MEHEQQGEQLKLLEAADFPAAPSFPNRWLFAGGGLGAGLGIGLGLALLVEMRDRSVRREEDVIALLEVPMLAFVPWAPSTAGDGHQRRGLRERIKPLFVR